MPSPNKAQCDKETGFPDQKQTVWSQKVFGFVEPDKAGGQPGDSNQHKTHQCQG